MKNAKTPYSENDLLMLSGLQHLAFCPRQWALIHLEGIWEENRLTVEGKHMHERVHQSDSEMRDGVRTVCGLRLRSLRLGLSGQADVVEFHPGEGAPVPFPVEYKRGKPKPDRCDEIQLCAQALCLEEMLDCTISAGALFYGKTRRRQDVLFTEELRNKTEELAHEMQRLFQIGVTPPAVYESKCDNCSLYPWCLPKTISSDVTVEEYINQVFQSLD